ncbi:TetR/AcrR family transcriptional regulator [Bradyrhizobium mercantei]|uniref:TetR/AcrR family transcriptional regulator n=1 Tax=Bradyrhizobium mercantei TaxID=1904807 RepID=UPI00097845B5|nr:TetR/AcrR family transcriptional regulator [Bradyrhizobium mercantei]
MRYPASETAKKHERILKEAARLFRERGFDGAGVAEIMEAAGLTHGAFYAHFTSKDALQTEAVERAFAQANSRIYALATNTSDAKQAFLDSYLGRAHRNHAQDGCPMAALGPEIARSSAARKPFTQGVKHILDGMVSRFRWKRKGIARRNAIHVLSAAVGAVILARAVDDPRFSDEILASVRDALASL